MVLVMQQVKIFKSVESELEDMERSMNEWIKETGAKIISITGNIAAQTPSSHGMASTFGASDIMVVVLYEL
jgi:hypothetical protein